MYSILFSILLASTYVSAIPMPLGVLYEYQPQGDEEKKRQGKFTDALDEANRQIGNMQEVLKDKNDPRIKTAFGPNANHDEIKEVVKTLATKKLKVQSMDPDLADTEMGKRKPEKADKNGKYAVNAFTPSPDGDGVVQPTRFGSVFFAGSNTKQRAGTIIHEATHQRAGTGDHVDHTTKRVIPVGEDVPEHAEINGGCKLTVPSYLSTISYVYPHSDNLDPPTKETLGSKYVGMRDSISNTHQNADSYRVFAALCSRSLYKRALLEDDPVGYYFSKRSQCNLPPDYFATKAAASKGTTSAATRTTSHTAANRKASIAKATSTKGAKDLQGGVKGTSTRKSTGATARKGLKTVKGTKATKIPKTAKGSTTAKVLKTAKAGKGLKAAKGAKAIKGVKATKGVKTVKGTKAAEGLKTVKGSKTVEGLKTAKASKGVKAAKGAKTVQAAKASTGVNVAVKTATGAKGTKGTGSSKSVKATKSPKSTAAHGEKTAPKVATKATGSAAVKAAVPKAAVKVAAAVPKKRKNLRRDLGMFLDESD